MLIEKEEKYQLDYHVDHNEKIIPLCNLLDCFEQICYFEFRKISDFNPWVYFCDDINSQIANDDLYIMKTDVKTHYQDFKEWTIKGNHHEKITELLHDEGSLILQTAFNYVPDYAWWTEGKETLHLQHLTYLLGEDIESYYIADSPYVFLNIEKIKQKFNPSIVKIPKEHFDEAFKRYCKVSVVRFHDIPMTQDGRLLYFQKILAGVVKDYYFESPDFKVGRNALLYMADQCALGKEQLFVPFFIYHLAVSKRIMLKRCLGIYKDSLRNYFEIVSYLDKSIEYMKKIKDLSYEHLYYSKLVSSSVGKELDTLVKNEDMLIKTIQSDLLF